MTNQDLFDADRLVNVSIHDSEVYAVTLFHIQAHFFSWTCEPWS